MAMMNWPASREQTASQGEESAMSVAGTPAGIMVEGRR